MNNYYLSHERTIDCHNLMTKEGCFITNNNLVIPVLNLQFSGRSDMRRFFQNKSVIYIWKTTHNNKIYIGSSKNFWNRFLRYSGDLLIQTVRRSNQKLLKEVCKYGSDILSLGIAEILETKDEREIKNIEQVYLDKYTPFNQDIGYNICSKTHFNNYAEIKRDVAEYISRCRRGENGPSSKLNSEQVQDIKWKLFNGAILRELAEEYGVSTTVISNIKRGKTWAHIKISDEAEALLKSENEKNKHKFSEDFVKQIKTDFKNGMRSFQIAKKYNLIYSTVHSIKNGHIYGYINAL